MTPSAFILARSVGPITGLGLFSGRPGSVVIHPGKGDGLIRFVSVDGTAIATADAAHVTTDTAWSGLPPGVPIRNTTLLADNGSRCFATTEHLMAALNGLGVLEATVELDGPEVPILDGSALPFVNAVTPALVPAPRPFRPIILDREVRIEHQGASIIATPSDTCSITYQLDYGPTSPLKTHAATWNGSPEAFAKIIAPARTFSLRAEAEMAKKMGLFPAFSPKDLPVVGDDGELIDNAWRFPGEAAAHKLLDLIGDLRLASRPILATIVATRSGHALAHGFCKQIANG